ncbi:MAG: outer membrane beta-barrel protein [Gemmatimonadota bacterium]|nr:MAG: outer membrane beta-barrel protein [Gemmatimonadota bacterium]
MIRRLFAVATLLVLTVKPAMGQLPGIELEPYIGVFIPIMDVIDQEVDTEDVVAGQKEALAVGGRITLWLGGALGVEGNFGYAFSDVTVSEGGVASDTSANVYAADARLVLKFGIPLAPVSFHVNGGVALIGRSGDAYDDVSDGKTNVGGVVGLGTRVKLPGILAIRADADAYLYKTRLTIDNEEFGGEFQFDSQFQSDILLSAGLVIGLGP